MLRSYWLFFAETMQTERRILYLSPSPCVGQAEDTIRLITKLALIKLLLPWWLTILQSLEPPGAKNAHLSDVRGAVEVKLTLKSQTANAYGSVLLKASSTGTLHNTVIAAPQQERITLTCALSAYFH